MRRRLLAVSLVAAILAGCAAPGSTVQPGELDGTLGQLMTDVDALVHVVGDNASGRVATGLLPASLFVGHDAGEPTLGVTAEGVLFYAASTFDNICTPENPIAGTCLPRTDILRSMDGGATWEDVTPKLPGGVNQHPDTGDPMVYVDVSTGAVFDIDQRGAVACYSVTRSDDLGESWGPDGYPCLRGAADHQTIVAAKPKLLPTQGYPNIVYVCYNGVATSICTRSLDGGLTFVDTGPVGTRGVEASGGGEFEDTVCSALVGHLKADSAGNVYLPRRQCGAPLVAITRDDGNTWIVNEVSADVPAYNCGGTCGMDPTIAVDAEDNVYYLYQGADGHLWLSFSADGGDTWSPVVDVLAPGLTVANLAAIAAGDAGKVALAYIGSDVEGGYDAEEDAVENATWDGYLAIIEGANTAAPTVTTVRVNPADDPLVRGTCGPGRCHNPGLVDFIDIVVDADGRPWVALVDNCIEVCATAEGTPEDSTAAAGFVGTLSEGPALRGAGRLVPIHPAIGQE